MMSGMQPAPADLMCRVRGEYLEMPGLSLTLDQARRLWGLERHTCDRLLSALVDGGFLWRRPDGTYIRRGRGGASVRGGAAA